MVINVLVGFVFLGVLGWLLYNALHKPPTPGELIRKKQEARVQEQVKLDAAMSRVSAFAQERLDELYAAVQDMRKAVGEGQRFGIDRDAEAVELHFAEMDLRVTHHIRELNLDREHMSDAYLESLEQFQLVSARRAPEYFNTLEALLERLAALIVELSQPKQ